MIMSREADRGLLLVSWYWSASGIGELVDGDNIKTRSMEDSFHAPVTLHPPIHLDVGDRTGPAVHVLPLPCAHEVQGHGCALHESLDGAGDPHAGQRHHDHEDRVLAVDHVPVLAHGLGAVAQLESGDEPAARLANLLARGGVHYGGVLGHSVGQDLEGGSYHQGGGNTYRGARSLKIFWSPYTAVLV